MSSGVYASPKIEVRFESVATNTTPTAAVRGAGRPEATQLLERDMDLFAAGTYGSASAQIGGAAAQQASMEVVEKAKQLAAEQLEADPHDMVLELGAGVFHVAGAPSPSLSWSELAGGGTAGRAERRDDFNSQRRDRRRVASRRPPYRHACQRRAGVARDLGRARLA